MADATKLRLGKNDLRGRFVAQPEEISAVGDIGEDAQLAVVEGNRVPPGSHDLDIVDVGQPGVLPVLVPVKCLPVNGAFFQLFFGFVADG